MITSELKYNPYINVTEIKFNGKKPRINSLVEKYQNEMLHTWLERVPDIFCDEMNGYDFELDFYGTELDCQELRNVFLRHGVTEKSVSIVHKMVLEDRYKKVERIEKLLKWFKETPNRNFDEMEFRKQYRKVFDDDYSFVFVRGKILDFSELSSYSISCETVGNIHELDDTDLTNTPILFWVDSHTISLLSEDIKFLKAKGITQEQLFFYFDSNYQRDMLYRFLQDIGIHSPNIVDSFDNEAIINYFEIYTITDYICSGVKAFNEEVNRIQAIVDKENLESEKTNGEIHSKLKEIDEAYDKVKDARERFEQAIIFEDHVDWEQFANNLRDTIRWWKKKKTNTTNDDEAVRLAKDLNTEIHDGLNEIYESLKSIIVDVKLNMVHYSKDLYKKSGIEDQYMSASDSNNILTCPDLSDISQDLLKLYKQETVQQNEGLFTMFRKTDSVIETITQNRYDMTAWRQMAEKTVDNPVNELLGACKNLLTETWNGIRMDYMKHLEKEMDKLLSVKSEVSSKLSADEMIVQQDNEWLETYKEFVIKLEKE